MTWATRFRIREYVRESLWVVPPLGAIIQCAAPQSSYRSTRT